MRLTVTLPLPPSTNSVYRKRGKNAGMFMTPEGADFKLIAMCLIKSAFNAQCRGSTFYQGQKFALGLLLHFPDNRRCDLDNRVKLCQDATAACLSFDDSQIDRLIVTRGLPDKKNPRCELTLTDDFTITPIGGSK